MSKTDIVYQNLKELAVEMSPEDIFPSTREIMQRFQVSQATVIQATERLIREGLIVKQQGRRTRITKQVRLYKNNAKPCICLILPHWNSAWLGGLEAAFLALAKELDYQQIVHIYDHTIDFNNLPKTRIDAFLAIPWVITTETLLILKKLSLPVLFIGDIGCDDFSIISADNSYIGILAANHLIKLGHKKLAFAYIRNEKDQKCTANSTRLRGFQQICEINNVECQVIEVVVNADELDYQAMYNKIRKTTAAEIGFTALYTDCAPQCLRALLENNYQVPDDISVITIGEDPLFNYTWPSLTSISSDQKMIVQQAIEQLFIEIKNPEQKCWITIKHELIQRESTAPIQNRRKP